jgi:hypothetical protein
MDAVQRILAGCRRRRPCRESAGRRAVHGHPAAATAAFGAVSPSLAWRIPAMVVAVAAYYACLRAAAWLFRRFGGSGDTAAARLWRRAMLAGAGAAIVACAAEVFGGRAQPLPLLLALGTTLEVGFTVTSMNGHVMAARAHDLDQGYVGRSRWVIAVSIVVAAGFVSVIGPGLDLMRVISARAAWPN